MTANSRVLWLTENYPPQRGGMAVSCDRIVRFLRQSGTEIDVAHFSRRYLKWKTVDKLNGQQFNCPVREDISDTMNRLWIILERKTETEKYTHVAAFGGSLPMLAGPVFSKWLDIPLITMIRGNDFDSGIFDAKRSDVLRYALAGSAQICAVTNDKAAKISKLFSDARVVWTPNGIDRRDWEFTDDDRARAGAWRKRNVAPGKKVFGLFGQLKRKKGGMFFLENLRRSGFTDKVHLLFVGDIEPEMQLWLEENSETISFTNLEFLDRFELLPFYAACDFVVIPSFYDGMPNVLLESAALGVPSISSKTGGMLDILEDKINSLLFCPADDHECRRAIGFAATIEAAEYSKLQKQCVALSKRFTCEAETENYQKVFSESSNDRSLYAKN